MSARGGTALECPTIAPTLEISLSVVLKHFYLTGKLFSLFVIQTCKTIWLFFVFYLIYLLGSTSDTFLHMQSIHQIFYVFLTVLILK